MRSSPLQAVPSIALGSIGVTPIEMASVVLDARRRRRLLEADGDHEGRAPERQGRHDAGWGKPQRERVIPDWVASTVTQVLEQNMLYGTGTGAHLHGHTDAGKTGTTDNYADAWFSGYTPRLEATVWIGYPTGEIPMLNVHGIAVSGPTFPADIWHLYMETAVGKKPDVPFPPATTQPVWTSVARAVRVQRLVRHDVDRHDDAVDSGRAEAGGAEAADNGASGDDDRRSACDDRRSSDDRAGAADGSRAADAVAVAGLLTLEEAQARVLACVRTLAVEVVPIDRAAGRVTAEPARATVDLPSFPSSAMDGFAVRAADVPGTLPVVDTVAAGRPTSRVARGG